MCSTKTLLLLSRSIKHEVYYQSRDKAQSWEFTQQTNIFYPVALKCVSLSPSLYRYVFADIMRHKKHKALENLLCMSIHFHFPYKYVWLLI